jgi:hypothetical protein
MQRWWGEDSLKAWNDGGAVTFFYGSRHELVPLSFQTELQISNPRLPVTALTFSDSDFMPPTAFCLYREHSSTA